VAFQATPTARCRAVSRETVSAEYDRVASMALRVFHETALSSIPTEGKLKPPSL